MMPLISNGGRAIGPGEVEDEVEPRFDEDVPAVEDAPPSRIGPPEAEGPERPPRRIDLDLEPETPRHAGERELPVLAGDHPLELRRILGTPAAWVGLDEDAHAGGGRGRPGFSRAVRLLDETARDGEAGLQLAHERLRRGERDLESLNAGPRVADLHEGASPRGGIREPGAIPIARDDTGGK
jgi:hypothetical protein